MKKQLIMLSLLLSGFSVISCASEEDVTEVSAKPVVEFEKTTEMLNFEDQLKNWFQAKQYASVEAVNERSKAAQDLESAAKELLQSLGKAENESARKADQDMEEYVRVAMKEYSKKLTEMYHQKISQ